MSSRRFSAFDFRLPTIKTMKRLLSISIFALLLSLTMQAQVVSLNVSDKPLRDVLPMVEQQCDYHFFYNSSLPGLDKHVTVSLNNASLEQVLKQLFNGTGIVYKMAENKEGSSIVKLYFKSFKANFKQATVLWILMLIVLGCFLY